MEELEERTVAEEREREKEERRILRKSPGQAGGHPEGMPVSRDMIRSASTERLLCAMKSELEAAGKGHTR